MPCNKPLSLTRGALAGIGALCLVACVSGPLAGGQPLQINGMMIENQTPAWVSAARLLVPSTGTFVSCGNISPDSRCSTTFPEANYTGNPVEITWSQAGQIYSTGEFVIELPEDVDEDVPAIVRVVIAGPGSAGALIVQQNTH